MNLIAKKPVHINGGWVQAGHPVEYGVAGFNYEAAARRGLIESVDGDEIENPKAQTAPAESTPVTDALAGLKEQHEAALKAEREKAANWQHRANEEASKVTSLTRQVQQLTQQVQDAQANAAKPEDQAALAEYREVVGTLLAHDFPSRKILLEHGYYTPETVQAASDDELNDLKGISDAKLADIRKVAPYSSGE